MNHNNEKNVYQQTMDLEYQREEGMLEIRSDYAFISKENLDDIENLVALFDRRNKEVHVVDSNHVYFGSIGFSEMRQMLKEKKAILRSDVYIYYLKNEKKLKKNIHKIIREKKQAEVPIIKNHLLVSVGGFCDIDGDARSHMPLLWSLISEMGLNDFFSEHPRILISSKERELGEFYKYFSEKVHIDVYNKSLKKSNLYNDYDILLYDADIWDFRIKKCSIRSLYENLLRLDIAEYFYKNDIMYYCICCHGIVQDKSRILPIDKEISNVTGTWGGKYKRYPILMSYNDSENCIIENGIRRTIGNMYEAEAKIICVGPCIAFGANVENDVDTVESNLTKLLNGGGFRYDVINYANFRGMSNDALQHLNRLIECDFISRGDVLIEFSTNPETSEVVNRNRVKFHSLNEFLNKKGDKGKYWSDWIAAHINKLGTEKLAKELYDMFRWELKKRYRESVKIPSYLDSIDYAQDEFWDEDVDKYLEDLKKECFIKEGRIGAIVMNCNPFTKGHMYLIDYASKQVDFLYIFVLEENKSEYSFNTRLLMAKENCKHHKNVRVFPSGRYIISSITFPDYFQKDQLKEVEVFPSKDLIIFSKKIAPSLNITVRFVGEEPFDSVTKQYNEAMKKILPSNGIEVIEIPRMDLDGEIISAKRVREYIKNGNIKNAKKILTKISCECLGLDKYDGVKNESEK